jgi:hypothetical protein
VRTFIVRPRIFVRPVHEFLVNPREETHRRVGEGVAEGLRLGFLLLQVSCASSEKLAVLGKPFLFLRRERGRSPGLWGCAAEWRESESKGGGGRRTWAYIGIFVCNALACFPPYSLAIL